MRAVARPRARAAASKSSGIGSRRRNHTIGGEIRCRFRQQRAGQPVDEQADSGNGTDREQHGRHEQPQLAGAPFAQQKPQHQIDPRGAASRSRGRRAIAPRRARRRVRSCDRNDRPAARRASRAPASCRNASFKSEQQVDDARAGNRIEVAGGLVREQHFRPRRKRARDGDALLLAARQLARIVARTLAQDRPFANSSIASPRGSASPLNSPGSITFSSAVRLPSSWND